MGTSGEPAGFCPSELLPSIYEACQHDSQEWWWNHMQKQAHEPGDWKVSAVDVWKRSPASWRMECMKGAMNKICSQIDGIDDRVMHCPELVHMNAMSHDPQALLLVAAKCAFYEEGYGRQKQNLSDAQFVP